MVIGSAVRELAFAREQVFDVAADIERYPEFLPWWISARIASRCGSSWRVEQTLGLGPLRLPFTSTALVQRPERIDVRCVDAPFRRYELALRFDAPSPTACRLSIACTIEFDSPLLQAIADRLVPSSTDRIVSAFAQRTRRLYGLSHA